MCSERLFPSVCTVYMCSNRLCFPQSVQYICAVTGCVSLGTVYMCSDRLCVPQSVQYICAVTSCVSLGTVYMCSDRLCFPQSVHVPDGHAQLSHHETKSVSISSSARIGGLRLGNCVRRRRRQPFSCNTTTPGPIPV